MADRNDGSVPETAEVLDSKLSHIQHRIMVLSGKGGVGKSSVAACIALGLAERGKKAGLMDVDIHGPSIPVIFGLEGERVTGDESGIYPVEVVGGLKIISIGLFIGDRDKAVIWRGPLKMSAIRQFIEDINWGDLDYLIIDAPPGTGDEPLSVVQLIPETSGIVVTTPQELALADVRRSINFCRSTGIDLLGLVENMSGLRCPHCGEMIELFKGDGLKELVHDLGVEVLASIPLDTDFAAWADRGGARSGSYRSLPLIAGEMDLLVDRIIGAFESGVRTGQLVSQNEAEEENIMRKEGSGNIHDGKSKVFAIPTEGGILCSHFGHCEKFTLVEAGSGRSPVISQVVDAPPHEPGLLPRWLAEKGVNTVIAGGMGARAQQLFTQAGVEVLCGAPAAEPLELVKSYLDGALALGDNVCDH